MGMSKTDVRDQIAQRHRQAIRKVMAERGLQVSPWCKRAGITEGALRNFLNGDSESMGANSLDLLAGAAGVTLGSLLGEEIHYKIDDELMEKAVDSILLAAKSGGKKLNRAQEMAYAVMLYNHLIDYKKQGEYAEPNTAMAALILKTSAN